MKVELLTGSAKNWFLKRRLDTNLCQEIDVKYTRDWQIGLKKNLQDSVVKPIIFTAQKIKFSVKDLIKFNLIDSGRNRYKNLDLIGKNKIR